MVAEGRREMWWCLALSLVMRLAQVSWRPLVALTGSSYRLRPTARRHAVHAGLGRVSACHWDKSDSSGRVGNGGLKASRVHARGARRGP